MNVDSEQPMAVDSTQAGQVNDGDGGFSTPEASSSSGEGIQKDGPVLDIWGAEVSCYTCVIVMWKAAVQGNNLHKAPMFNGFLVHAVIVRIGL
jgi:hypothetical protein